MKRCARLAQPQAAHAAVSFLHAALNQPALDERVRAARDAARGEAHSSGDDSHGEGFRVRVREHVE